MYCKLFTSLYQGTLRGRSDEILVFTNLLAHCDRLGVSDIHPKSISEEVGLPLERVQVALDSLEGIDPESRSPENEGRRISRLDEHRAWGWNVTNYAKYRAIKNEDDRREQNRLAQKKWREKNNPSATVIARKQSKPSSAHAEAEADGEEKKKAQASPAFVLPDRFLGNIDLVTAWYDFQFKYKKKTRAPMSEGTRDRHFKKLSEWGEELFLKALHKSIDNNWTDIFEPKERILGRALPQANSDADHAKGF